MSFIIHSVVLKVYDRSFAQKTRTRPYNWYTWRKAEENEFYIGSVALSEGQRREIETEVRSSLNPLEPLRITIGRAAKKFVKKCPECDSFAGKKFFRQIVVAWDDYTFRFTCVQYSPFRKDFYLGGNSYESTYVCPRWENIYLFKDLVKDFMANAPNAYKFVFYYLALPTNSSFEKSKGIFGNKALSWTIPWYHQMRMKSVYSDMGLRDYALVSLTKTDIKGKGLLSRDLIDYIETSRIVLSPENVFEIQRQKAELG